ncbi:MAG: hypothetical protein M1530_02475, partial [Candidatus Marsarchaeota archaeon]|nr:hypothetical protein [Candidatus Marsarchaeota archaeon]
KKFSFLWKKDKASPVEELRKVTAGKLARMPDTILRPGQDVLAVLPLIASRTDCIPVAEHDIIVGLVRGEDIVKFFAKELANDEARQMGGGGGAEETGGRAGGGGEGGGRTALGGGAGRDAQEADELEEQQAGGGGIGSEIDRILAAVDDEGEAPAAKISKMTGIAIKSVERLGGVLERHHLIRMKYTFTKGAVLARMEHGSK